MIGTLRLTSKNMTLNLCLLERIPTLSRNSLNTFAHEKFIALQCPSCSAKIEVEFTLIITKKLFKCENKKCKFGGEHYSWIKHYSNGKVVYPDNYKSF